MNAPRTLLVEITGKDRPGVTAGLFAILAPHGVDVVDIEQVVIRGRLLLATLLTAAPDEGALRVDVHRWAEANGLQAQVMSGVGDNRPRRQGRSHVTVLSNPLRPDQTAAVAGHVAACGGNIDRIVRLSKYPVTSIELQVSGIDPAVLRTEMAALATRVGVDVAVRRAGLHQRAKRLVVMDVDSTLIQDEVIELLAEEAGCLEEVVALTAAAMQGEADFAASLRSRVALLAGLEAATLEKVRSRLRLTPGARTLVRTLRRLGYECALVSGGFSQVIDPLAAELGIGLVAANTLELRDGRLTGAVTGPVVDRPGKAAALRRFARAAGVPLSQTVAIGDGANDLDMLAAAGLGVAFNAKPVVREQAEVAVNLPFLDTILFLLGITREEIEAADAEDGTAEPADSPAAD